MKKYGWGLLLIGIAGCSGPPALPNGAMALPEPRHARAEIAAPEDPKGVGLPIASGSIKKSGGPQEPNVTVGPGWSDRDRKDMDALVRAAITEMTSDAFRDNARQLPAKYSKIWLTGALGYDSGERVAAIVSPGEASMSYVEALVIPWRSGWASTRMERDGKLRIRLRRSLLDRWRSANPVVKACAINTMAHEISHTISRDPHRYLPAFTDTGDANADARNGVVASYFVGDLALCTALVRSGRIGPQDVAQCVPVWYEPGGLQSGRCYAFGPDDAVKWPKGRTDR
ncbi:hypothetical protein [Sphingopyxis sp. JAI128]|uniref:hypothetical protein n=1 Tax=Sphingopyxis sp. JAI128 TaxID=2723066 RepID=UPI00161A15FE|nr:hypothetical protein [Sphingopyxis sp. JAI128]MBB6425629.1 hypothetical protein [Sphingopyxis sp. JAI128]